MTNQTMESEFPTESGESKEQLPLVSDTLEKANVISLLRVMGNVSPLLLDLENSTLELLRNVKQKKPIGPQRQSILEISQQIVERIGNSGEQCKDKIYSREDENIEYPLQAIRHLSESISKIRVTFERPSITKQELRDIGLVIKATINTGKHTLFVLALAQAIKQSS